jgi:WD40 repeat protein
MQRNAPYRIYPQCNRSSFGSAIVILKAIENIDHYDGKTLASGDYTSMVSLWDVKSGEWLRTFQGHTNGQVYSVAWSVDGSELASACTDLTVRIWDVSTGAMNSWLAIAFLEQPIQLWDPQTGETVKILKSDRPYEGMNITGVRGISESQKAALKALGAIEV